MYLSAPAERLKLTGPSTLGGMTTHPAPKTPWSNALARSRWHLTALPSLIVIRSTPWLPAGKTDLLYDPDAREFVVADYADIDDGQEVKPFVTRHAEEADAREVYRVVVLDLLAVGCKPAFPDITKAMLAEAESGR